MKTNNTFQEATKDFTVGENIVAVKMGKSFGLNVNINQKANGDVLGVAITSLLATIYAAEFCKNKKEGLPPDLAKGFAMCRIEAAVDTFKQTSDIFLNDQGFQEQCAKEYGLAETKAEDSCDKSNEQTKDEVLKELNKASEERKAAALEKLSKMGDEGKAIAALLTFMESVFELSNKK